MKTKEKYETLLTPYAKGFKKSAPLPEYPRPQFKRDSYFSLNGEWDFEIKNADGALNYEGKICVPYPPESVLSGVERRIEEGESLIYKLKFTLPEEFNTGRTILHFGAVDQLCRVKLNGKEIFYHEGGYHPFSVDVTEDKKSGENELSVIVRDELDKSYPYGKQRKDRGGMWYTPVSGIWQTVWLEAVPENAIEALRITADSQTAKIQVSTKAKNVRLTLKESGRVYESKDGSFVITPQSRKMWSPENPYLYYFTLETENDRVESYFALREISIKDFRGKKRLCLNGKPYLFNGLLDQGYFPDGIFTPASYEAYRDDIMLAKSLGFNMLRKHIKIEPLVFYYYCDLYGIAVFQDMVNNSDYSFVRDTALPTLGIKKLPDKNFHRDEKTRRIFKDSMKETAELLYNSPSVLYYTVFNEGWGQFSADENYRQLKSIDSTRIIDATSGWFTQSESDVNSHHVYFKKAKIRDFSTRPAVLSEFGGYSFRKEGHLFGEANYGYSIYKTREEFEAAVTKLYETEVRELVKNGVSALVYTQLSDVEDETNGFTTYDRKFLKLDSKKFSKLMNELSKISTTEI